MMTAHPTNYSYEPLLSSKHIRVLCITYTKCPGEDEDKPRYSLVQHDLSVQSAQPDFEAISYTWGDPARISSLTIEGETPGQIGLTANLTEALPHLTRQSKTKHIWIDQICINQTDDEEKGVQICLMSEVYKKALRVIVWLGPEDESARICRQWLEAIAKLIPTLERSEKIMPGTPEYHADSRGLFIKTTFGDPETDPMFAPAIQTFWQRPWFTRGWIVQEFQLPDDILVLAGNSTFTLQDLMDLHWCPPARNTEWMSYRCLMQLKLYPFTDPAPLRYLRVMAAIAGEFDTKEVVDRLFGCLGLMEGLALTPNYALSTKENFTRFAVTIAKDYGSLDFLSFWSANLDPLVPNTPPEVLGLPSWVPSWTPWPLSAPWRLATGGSRQYRHTVSWNAAKGTKHAHDQGEDAVSTGRLHVRGRIVDHIEHISSAKFSKYWDIDEKYTNSLVTQIKSDLPGLEQWRYKDLIHFLNVAAAGGSEPEICTDCMFDSNTYAYTGAAGRDDGIAVCLTMGRGRRVVRTEGGRLGLAPAVGSRPKSGMIRGSVIAIVYGCTVPVVLEAVDGTENEWKLVGDCYVEGVMKGEAANGKDDQTQTFILV